MKRNALLNIAFTLVIAATLIACQKEENDFAGSDNHIIGFELEVSGVNYRAAISDDQIILSVPEGLSLTGAKAEVRVSENASIDPDPSQITDWNSEEQFVVTSYNNRRKSYIYRLERTSVSTSGNVILTTQAEVDAFAQTGISVIDGNLTIGKTAGATAADSIRNLAGLSALRQIAHNITINNTFAGEDLSGLASIEKIGGLRIGTVASLTDIALPNLGTAGTNISISSVTAKKVKMPLLTFVGESFTVKSDSLQVMDFGELVTVGGDMIFNGSNTTQQKNTMEMVSFPKLASIGGAMTISYWPAAVKINVPVLENVGGMITFTYWNKTEALDFPALKTAGGLTLSQSTALVELNIPVLETINGNIAFSTLGSLEKLENNSLKEVNGGISLNLSAATWVMFHELISVSGTLAIPAGSQKLGMPYFPKLTYIGGDLDIRTAALTDFTGFEALEEIGERLYLYNATGITSLSALSSLKKVGTSVYLYGLTTLNEVDVRGIEVSEIVISGSTWNNLKIIGDDVFEGKLTMNGAPSSLAVMPEIIGFKSLGGLVVSSGYYNGDVELTGIEEVKGLIDFSSCNYCPVIRMPDLKKAGGIKFSYNNSLVKADFPSLEEITGESTGAGFIYPVSSNIAEINLPLLREITGNFNLTGLTASRPLGGVNMPAIEQITGMLTIGGTNNTVFTNVTNFSNLTSVGGVTISNFKNLNDFAAFQKAIPTLTETTWKISGCGYNPTYQDMTSGEYAEP